jgi:hypothetical protein
MKFANVSTPSGGFYLVEAECAIETVGKLLISNQKTNYTCEKWKL